MTHQVEIIAEELISETMKEFERIKTECSAFSCKIKSEAKNRMDIILDIIRHDINDLLQEALNKGFLIKLETLYKNSIKNIHMAQEEAWLLLTERTAECKRQIKKCFQYACEIVDKKDKTLEKVYKASKDFLKSNLKETSKDIKGISAVSQHKITDLCKDAKRRVTTET